MPKHNQPADSGECPKPDVSELATAPMPVLVGADYNFAYAGLFNLPVERSVGLDVSLACATFQSYGSGGNMGVARNVGDWVDAAAPNDLAYCFGTVVFGGVVPLAIVWMVAAASGDDPGRVIVAGGQLWMCAFVLATGTLTYALSAEKLGMNRRLMISGACVAAIAIALVPVVVLTNAAVVGATSGIADDAPHVTVKEFFGWLGGVWVVVTLMLGYLAVKWNAELTDSNRGPE